MKRFLTLCMTLLLGVNLFAQTNAERLVVYDKAYNVKGYLAERLDSVVIKKVNGDVRADIQVLKVEKDAISFSVTRTASCPCYKFFIMPANTANMLTDDAAAANYIDKMTDNIYYDDFTNGTIPTDEIQNNTKYVAMTLGIDQYNTLCTVSRAEFTSYKEPVIGNPQVEVVVNDIKEREFTVSFTPNSDVAGYAVIAGKKGEIQQQFEQMGAGFGFSNFGEMVKGWGFQYTKAGTSTWTDMEPNTTHEVFVQAWDVKGTFADCQVTELTTKMLGGTGAALVTIELGKYGLTDWGGQQLYTQEVKFIPNDQTSCYRFLVDYNENYENDIEGTEEYIKSEPPFPNMMGWFQYEPFTNEYQINPGEDCIALAAAKNGVGEWGEICKLRIKPTAPNGVAPMATPVKNKVVARKQLNAKATSSKGKVPSMPQQKGFRLVEK